MKRLAEIIGMTEQELKEFYMSKVNKAMRFGLSEKDAKMLVIEVFRKQLGLL